MGFALGLIRWHLSDKVKSSARLETFVGNLEQV
jgi:hypothetical protein